ncbi:CREB-regulated transcription coactivator 2 isoform X1 [Acyrthosiphon pisum]|uniref:CREB-regulated transcription coactivator 1 n=1 Tax=Acyrthosiphon pisum TaxID=7029 RepID=A0A8R2NT66_ACYPI|nr:CREB-regulated transcription coactivator 2 isoform X1 [Acyrthosiphon pisum]XP_029346041.1 CREB-regulated transcription coactivator 2 isoform X1 [Acyrthosiphon pisum]
MANPRKFSEKIALHNQKQAEETAAFEKIMREVSDATTVKLLANGCEEVVVNPNQQARGRPVGYRERGRSVGSVGPMRSEKRSADKSPYSSGPYLSPPPPDTSWRRTHSDSALHQSVSQSSSTESLAHLHSPGSQRRTLIDNQQYDKKRYLSASPDKRPRSCCDVPRVPGIHVFTTQQEPGVVQIPIGNNTGSLPDLTNFQFSQPIHAPLDQDDQYNLSSPYNSNSPLTTDGCSPQGSQGSQGTPSQSPSVLSPVSINSRTPPTRFSFTSSPPPDSPTQTTVVTCDIVLPNHLSVPYFMNHRLQRTCKGFTVDNSPGNGNSGENCNNNIKMQMLGQNSNMNCVTGQMNGIKMNSVQTLMYQHIPLSPAQQQTHQSCGLVDGQTEINSSHLNIGNSQINNINTLGSYRNQQSNRPSPQSSPGLTIQYGSSSPLCSSPQSPSSPSSSSVSSTNQHQNYQTQKDFYSNLTQTNNLQHHFENFSMDMMLDWNQVMQSLKDSNPSTWITAEIQLDSPVSTGLEYIGSPTNTYLQQNEEYVNSEMTADMGYFSTSPSQSLQFPNQTHTTPNTPSSIPDIILTDFSNGDQLDNQNDFVKELNTTNAFDTDFFTNEDSIRQGLVDQIDLDHLEHLQMLAEPINDESTNNDHNGHFQM